MADLRDWDLVEAQLDSEQVALRRFADSLNLLELNDDDQRYVDEFAVKLESAPPPTPGEGNSTRG